MMGYNQDPCRRTRQKGDKWIKTKAQRDRKIP